MVRYLILLLIYPTCHKPIQPDKYHIILITGQSNVPGFANCDSTDYGSLSFLYNNTGWEHADGSLNKFSSIGTHYYRCSFVNRFGILAGQNNLFRDYQIGLVVNGQGGSEAKAWADSLMAKSIARAQAALASNPNNVLTAVIYQQGESEWGRPHLWLPQFRRTRHVVDSLLGYNTPMLVGGISDHRDHDRINDTIRQVQFIHDCYYVSSDSIESYDQWHFNAVNARKFGERFWQVYQSIQ